MRKIIGIDPGATGGVCIMNEDRSDVHLYSLSNVDADTVDTLWPMLQEDVRIAVIEKVGAFPGQGLSSTFTFGMRYGIVKALVLASKVPMVEVHPKTWQKVLGLTIPTDFITEPDKKKKSAKRRKLQKEKSYNMVRQLYPTLEVTKDTADGVLIAEYGLRVMV